MNGILEKICAHKRDEVAAKIARLPLAEVRTRAANAGPTRGFRDRLTKDTATNGIAVIAEIKRASPSKGLIREDFDPAVLARAYEAGGASCLSVLTDEHYFQGADDHLGAARSACALPVLRKDFTLDPYQVHEARALGADCILLILAALEDGPAREFEALALELGLDVLIEVHNEEEAQRAAGMQSQLIGINNRDLTSFAVDLATTERLAPLFGRETVLVSESGIGTPGDIARVRAAGATAVLVGESLMRQTDVTEALQALMGRDEENGEAVASR